MSERFKWIARPGLPPIGEQAGPDAPYHDRNFTPGAPHNLPQPGQRPTQQGLNLLYGANGEPEAPTNTDALRVIEAHRYARLITLNFNVGVVSGLVLTESSGLRNFLMMRNASVAANLFIAFAQEASALDPLLLVPGQIVLFDTVVPQDDIYALASAAGGVLAMAYSTIPAA